jgi:citrate lyase subunit beta/citryl-CoA lyase
VGKWAIHPSQIAIANEIFAPTPLEIERATAAVRAVQEAEKLGLGAASFQGMMIDAATARIFDAVLVRARQCGIA